MNFLLIAALAEAVTGVKNKVWGPIKYYYEINTWFPKNVDFYSDIVQRANGIKVERVPAEFDSEIKRLGEKFSREWVRSVGNAANQIFVPYYAQ